MQLPRWSEPLADEPAVGATTGSLIRAAVSAVVGEDR